MATILVGPTRTYTTIQAGINAAASGDIVEIDDGTYQEVVRINKDNLTVRGAGDDCIISGGTNSDGSHILPTGDSQFPVDSQTRPAHYTPLVWIQNSGCTLTDVTIQESRGRGLSINSTSSVQANWISNVTVDNITVQDIANRAIHCEHCDNVTVRNFTVRRGADFAQYSRASSTVNWPVIVNALHCGAVTFELFDIRESWGEGVAAGRGSDGVIIRNGLSATNFLGVYIQRAKNATVDNVITFMTQETLYKRVPGATGIGLNNEAFGDYDDTEGITIQNSVSVNAGYGLAIFNQTSGGTYTDVTIDNLILVEAIRDDTPTALWMNASNTTNFDITNITIQQSQGNVTLGNQSVYRTVEYTEVVGVYDDDLSDFTGTVGEIQALYGMTVTGGGRDGAASGGGGNTGGTSDALRAFILTNTQTTLNNLLEKQAARVARLDNMMLLGDVLSLNYDAESIGAVRVQLAMDRTTRQIWRYYTTDEDNHVSVTRVSGS